MPRESDDITSTSVNFSSESEKSRIRRKALGIYYTPPDAALILARWAIREAKDVILEPSFGGCAMLSAAVSVFKSLGNPAPSEQLFGFDVDAKAFEHLNEMGVENANGNFKKADFLRSHLEGLKVDAVLANPPFVSYHRQNASQRRLTAKLRDQYFPDLPRFASLWAYFLLHSMTFLRPGGRMAFVLPNAIGTADYGRALLKHLSKKFNKVEVLHVAERLFIQAGADERIALLLLSDYSPNGIGAPNPLAIREISKINEISNLNFTDQPKNVDEKEIARAALKNLQETALTELENAASIQIGEVVGDIRFFVRPRIEWEKEDIPDEFLHPILTRSSQVPDVYIDYCSPIFDNSQIPYILIPPIGKMPRKVKSLLESYGEDLVQKNKTFQKRTVWHRCSYTINADAFIGSMNHDWPKVIGNNANISCSNSYYKISLNSDAKAYKPWLPIISLTTPFRLSAEIFGRVRGSGGIKLEPSDAKKLLIPKRLPKISAREFKAVLERINRLVCKGDIDAASQLADSIIFIKSGYIDATTMFSLRQNRIRLTSRRICTA